MLSYARVAKNAEACQTMMASQYSLKPVIVFELVTMQGIWMRHFEIILPPCAGTASPRVPCVWRILSPWLSTCYGRVSR